MRLAMISDTHSLHADVVVPEVDVLVVAGDFTGWGRRTEIQEFNTWLAKQPARYKVVVAGNHDICLMKDPSVSRLLTAGYYLQDSGIEIEGIRFYGSPWTPRFGSWAFMCNEHELYQKWQRIPDNTDVLITHGPPFGILDINRSDDRTGSASLLDAVLRIKPQVHVFGHIHESQGCYQQGGTTFCNVAICDLGYKPSRKPSIIDVFPKT